MLGYDSGRCAQEKVGDFPCRTSEIVKDQIESAMFQGREITRFARTEFLRVLETVPPFATMVAMWLR